MILLPRTLDKLVDVPAIYDVCRFDVGLTSVGMTSDGFKHQVSERETEWRLATLDILITKVKLHLVWFVLG
jgi:hypothetical protein